MLHSTSKFSSPIPGQAPPKRDSESKPALPTKRKREALCRLGSFTKPFSIKPCSESPYDKLATFKPVRIIGRAQLPLTFLDTSPDSSFAPNRLFSAAIDVLETPNDVSSSPKVLIARKEDTKLLYAVERVRPCVFSLCKLAPQIKEKDVESLWDPGNLRLYPALPRSGEDVLVSAQWWEHAAVKVEREEIPIKRVRISMLRPKAGHIVSEPQPKTEPMDYEQVSTSNGIEQMEMVIPEIAAMAMEPPSPQQLLETFVQQYLDAVYMSKSSLAYFAKGPITRVRNAFNSPEEGAPPTNELVSFLRSMLVSHKVGEKKYLQKLPEVIKTIPPGMFSDDEQAPGTSKPRKSKKKIKLSKDGLYPQEEDIVKRWWLAEMSNDEHHGEETLDHRIKRRIGDLRVREALAQMILMLEIIALEALSTYKEPTDTDPTTVGDAETQAESQATKPKKRKKKMDDIKLLLDLQLDKLCIWQSVDQDGILDFDAKTSNHGDEKAGKSAGGDRLQGFCVEVLVPFYMTRLPEQARMISKKLGGPVQATPPKRKAMRLPTTSRKSGEPKEPVSKKSRRSLSRVATDGATQAAQRGTTPSLIRSATDSLLIKRETSEVPMAAIPFQRSPSNAARQSLSHFKHLKGRQIDLSTPTAAATAKIKQKQRVEEDLKEAITALKKPNRGLAVGTYVDDLERRGLGSASKSRKPSTTVRKVTKDVQVSATPRVVKRTKDMVEVTPIHHRNPFVRDDFDPVPPSSGFCIPSSAVRPVVPATVQRYSTAPPITETPSKAPVRKLFQSSTGKEPSRAIFATPARRRAASPPDESSTSPTAIFATPFKDLSAAAPRTIFSNSRVVLGTPTKATSSTPKTAPPQPPVFATPTKAAPAATVSETPLPSTSKPNDEAEPSIYDALGWNDDDDFM